MKQPRTFKPQLRIVQALAFLADQSLGADLAIHQFDFPMASDVERLHGRNVAHDLKAWIGFIHQKPGHARITARHHDRKVRVNGTADEPLVTINHPVFTLSGGSGGQHARVRTHAWGRLGHRKAGAQFAARKRFQVALTLPWACEFLKRSNVRLARRRALQRGRAEEAAARLFKEGAALFPGKAEAALARRQPRGSQPALYCSVPQLRGKALDGRTVVRILQVLAWNDLVIDEVAQPGNQGGKLAGGSCQTHGLTPSEVLTS